ncbi:sigma-70 family RNA polymerase sigma factor [Ornithinibacillus sp. L9]|uniref:RNA polymerase sigma factor n=1 Tax=Ornithinibacillus caprae TaxID=2678566 RepID=A0A6N8FNZ7_9BACI|nr:RNA polymerase sigma factor [Ornithinibacillus caprae]MUK90606.1 sigma-70 family RNA polymerase sigma factor [Ornithinibacillus caprae]
MRKEKPVTEADNYEKLLFDMFYGRIFRTAYYIVKDEHLAQDVVQETFIKAFKHIDSVKDGYKLGAWLGSIATRTSIDLLRKRRNYVPLENVNIDKVEEFDVHASPVEENMEENYIKEMLHETIKKLEPPEYREIVLLKYHYELMDKEIAELLGININTVKTRFRRAKQKLKRALYQEVKGEETF